MDIFLFVLGYIIQMAAAFLLLFKISRARSIYGLSVDTQICFMLANVVRCIWTLDTRLVETTFAYLELLGSTIASIGCCLLCYKYYHTTTMHAINYLRFYSLAGIALVVAFFFHPSDTWIDVQILVAFTMYIEAMGILQIFDLRLKGPMVQYKFAKSSCVIRMGLSDASTSERHPDCCS